MGHEGQGNKNVFNSIIVTLKFDCTWLNCEVQHEWCMLQRQLLNRYQPLNTKHNESTGG